MTDGVDRDERGPASSVQGADFARVLAYARRSCRSAPRKEVDDWSALEAGVLGDMSGLPGEEYALRAFLRQQLGSDVFESWFARLRWEGVMEKNLILSVPAGFVRSWIKSHFAKELYSACKGLFPAIRDVKLVVRNTDHPRGRFCVKGLMKWFDCRRGYGFIAPFDELPDVFICLEDVQRANVRRLLKDTPVFAQVERTAKGLRVVALDAADEDAIDPEGRPFPKALPKTECGWLPARCISFDDRRRSGVLLPMAGKPAIEVSGDVLQHYGIVQFEEHSIYDVKWGIGPHGCVAVAIRPCRDQGVYEEFEEVDDLGMAKTETRDTSASSRDVLRPTTPLLRDLAGMDDARRWGEDLARDIKLYRHERLNWEDVDPGVVLHGLPGTGKTTFAKALAATCKIPLIAASYTKWQQSGSGHLGNVLSAMEADFATAKLNAPCILFIDELDTIPKRGATARIDDWWVSIVNALLEKMDGIAGRPGVVIVGACNDPRGLDPALIRAGRLDRKIAIPMPSVDALATILALHLGSDAERIEDVKGIAMLCAGMSGADIVQLVREARRANRKKTLPFSREDFLDVLDKRFSEYSDELKWRIAVHEAGHALVAIATGNDKDVSIALGGRDGIGGRLNLAFENTSSLTRKALDERLMLLLAGRAAEQVVLGNVSGGAGGAADSDLARATQLALEIVSKLGLGDDESLVWYGPSVTDIPLLLERMISDQVRKILDNAYQRALNLVHMHDDTIQHVATVLLERRALAREDLLQLIDDRGTSASTHEEACS